MNSISREKGKSIEQFSFIKSNNSDILICIENLMFFIDMVNAQSSESQTISIEENFEGPNEDELFTFNQNQNTSKIRRIIESHDTKWIVYQPEKCQNSNPFDIDDHTVSSIERI